MVAALDAFQTLQVGKETVAGTLVAATKVIPCRWSLTPDFRRFYSDLPRNRRATRGGGGTIVRKETLLSVNAEATPEDLLWPCSLGILGSVSPSGAGPYTWTFLPGLSSAAVTLDTATFEVMEGDGVTNHYAKEFGYAMCRSLGLEWAAGEPVRYTAEYVARAVQTTTPTPALSPYATRTILPSDLTVVSIDTTWAGLGGTAVNGVVRSASFKLATGIDARYTLDGRSDLDLTGRKISADMAFDLGLVMEFDSTGAARSFTDYEAGSIKFIRLKTTVGTYYLQLDLAGRIEAPPALSVDGATKLASVAFKGVVDETADKFLQLVLNNSASTL